MDAIAEVVEGLLADTLRRLYWRLGRWYLPIFAAVETVAAVGICLGSVWLVSRYRAIGLGDFAIMAGTASACGVGVAAAAVRLAWPLANPVSRWVTAREPKDAELAWRSALELPLVVVSARGCGALAAGLVPSLAVATAVAAGSLGDFLALLGVSAIAVAYGAVLHVFAFELALRPVVIDIATALPPSFRAARTRLSLRWKLFLILPAINVVSGVTVAALAPRRDGLHALGATLVIAAGVAVTIAFVLSSVVGGAILGAVGELGRGVRRVRAGDVRGRVAVSSTDELGDLGDAFNDMVAGLAERTVLRDALGSYVNPDLPDRVVAQGLRIPAEEFEVTIVFADLIGFTSFSESATPTAAVERVNEFLAAVVPIVVGHGGQIDKFLGDGLLAVFGAPQRLVDHADRAYQAACEIATSSRLPVAVGVNSGRVVAGTIGTEGRYEFTVIGDAVNVAARIEHATRELQERLLITESTRALLTGEPALRSLGPLELHGKREPVAVFAPEIVHRSVS